MTSINKFSYPLISIALAFSFNVFAGDHGSSAHHDTGGKACEGFGPQTPRDIDNAAGDNK